MSIADRISIQLYSARKFPPLDAQLATFARLGYRNVEPYGALFDNPDALRESLKKHKLKTPTAHVGIDKLRSNLDAVAKLAKDFDIELLIVPFIAPDERPKNAEEWRKFGAELGGYQKRLAAHGVDLAWHNHSFEVEKLADGSYPLDHILGAAPGLRWEADIGWIQWSGEDPAVWLKKYRDRIAALHIKDLAPKGENPGEDGQADVGHGVLDWKKLMPAINEPNVKYLVMEHDNPNDYERFARRSFATVSAW